MTKCGLETSKMQHSLNGSKTRYYVHFIVFLLHFIYKNIPRFILQLVCFWQIGADLFEEIEVPQELRWIADGPNKDVPTFSGYKVDGVTYSTKDRDDTRQVQCSGVCVRADTMVVEGKDQSIEHTSPIFYGVVTSIWDLDYNSFRIPLFRCKWVDMNKGIKVDDLGYTLVNLKKLGFSNDPFVLAKHVKQVC